MNALVDQALAEWGFQDASYALAAERENKVYRVSFGERCFALRLHRPGYRTDDEISSELEWMAAVASGGVSVPAPVASSSGPFLQQIGAVQVDVLNWVNGETLKESLRSPDLKHSQRLFFDLGRGMAKLHDASDKWIKPDGFSRAWWDRAGLVGADPLWDRFWENPTLSTADQELFSTFRDVAHARLIDIEKTMDFGLNHADLVPDNVLVDGTDLHFIDFDDGGFGFRLFDVATALLKHMPSPGFLQDRQALIQGYQSCRSLDLSELDLFMALRAATYVGWIISRADEPGGAERNDRFVTTLRSLATAYLQDQ